MSVLEIHDAQREGARLVIGLAGQSGSGKTVTAIMLAYGMADYDPSKIGFIDTENRRGSLNADVLQTATPPTNVPFKIGDLVAPFSPERYIAAIDEFEKAGVEVLIVDSITHEHEGPGGLLEIAGDLNKYWNRAKAEHKKFVNKLLQCNMHIIVCVRAREKSSPGQTAEGKKTYIDEGLQPITEKNLMFEMTASLMMKKGGQEQDDIKGMPPALKGVLGRGKGYITPLDGKSLRDWVDGAKLLDPMVEKYRNRLLSNCDAGAAQKLPKSNFEHIEECWNKTPGEMRAALGEAFHQTLVSSAQAYDKGKAEREAEEKASPDAGKPEPGSPAAAIAAAATAGRAAKEATPPKEPPPAKTEEPPAKEPAKPATPKPQTAPATSATPPADNVTPLRPAAQQTPPAADTRPLATPAAKKPLVGDPVF